MNKKWTLLTFIVAILVSFFFYVKEDFKPRLHFALSQTSLKALPNPLGPLSEAERSDAWGKEFFIAQNFYKELDLYQAITAFKRASFLAENSDSTRQRQIQYNILFCYYLALKYEEVIHTFENSILKEVDSSFAYFHDLSTILFECYSKLEQDKKASSILSVIKTLYPSSYDKLCLWSLLNQTDFPSLNERAKNDALLKSFLDSYYKARKSVSTTQLLNTFIPGSGYLYLGQYQSALTAFFLNGATLWASLHNFAKKSLGAALIFASVEAGWYFGGVYGAGEEANFYNQKTYEKLAIPYMANQELFPILLLKYGI